ncbi:MAG: hypothetical protein GY809_20510, partial [Planctomycetes bacterium]|nr:hypothetical protein [Planctomycetota bacterium]
MSELTTAVVDFRERREPAREIISGWMVNYENRADGTASVTDKPGYVYVLVDRGEDYGSGDIIRAFSRLRPIPGWAVRVSTTRDRPWEYTVLDVDRDAMGGSLDGIAVLEPHAPTHEWGGSPSGGTDVVYPRWLQLYDFGVWPVASSKSVTVNDGVYNPSGSKITLSYTSVDLTDWWPSGTQERWVVVCLSPSGTIELWPGPIGVTFLTNDDIPAVPIDCWWELAAVKMIGNEDEVTMHIGNENVVDLRFSRVGWWQCVGTGSGGGTGGASTFLELTDTEDTYSGYAGYYPRVNVGETALEWGASLYADFAGNLVWTEGTFKVDEILEYTGAVGVTVEGCVFEDNTALIGTGAANLYGEALTVRKAANSAVQAWDDAS